MRFNTTSEHFIETKFVVLKKKRSQMRFLTVEISLIGERGILEKITGNIPPADTRRVTHQFGRDHSFVIGS